MMTDAISSPDVSVLMCVYDGMPYLPLAVESVLEQKGVSFELVVVDDDSTDGSGDYLFRRLEETDRLILVSRVRAARTSRQSRHPREHVVAHPMVRQSGLTDCLNIGLRFCHNRYVARLDSDDLCLEGRLKHQFNYLEDNPDVSFLGGSANRIIDDGTECGQYHNAPIGHEEIIQRLRRFEAYCPHSSWFVRRSVFDELDGYHSEYSQDLDFMLRVSERSNLRFDFLPQPIIALRYTRSSLSYGKNNPQLDYAIASLAAHMLRINGWPASDVEYDALLGLARKHIGILKIRSLSFVYNRLVTGYLSLRAGKPMAAVTDMIASLRGGATPFGIRKKYRERRLRAVHAVVREYTGRALDLSGER